jgi:D-alanyl-D-alanine carboxypeptidase (penicillin-binding protein 5/6)
MSSGREKMNRFQKNIWVTILLVMAVIVMICPSSILCKESRVSKKPRLHPKAIASEKVPAQSKETASGPFQYDAKAVVLMDALTGQVLYEQNSNLKISPASFAKVMTLYVIFDAIRAGQLKRDDLVTVSERAWKRTYKTNSSSMFLKVGERVKVEDLLKGVAIVSGNDACVALAEHLSGSEEAFVSKMNEKAKAFALKDTQFRNSDGGSADGQYTTAREMAILSNRYIEDHPETLAFHSTVDYTYNGIKQGNRNTLLQKNIGVDGLKTGHLGEAGYHLVATAKREGRRMIAVVMGSKSTKKRAFQAENLLEYGFKNFSTVEAVKKGATFGTVKVKRGKVNQVGLTAAEDARVTVAKGKESLVSVVPQLPQSVLAPIQKDQVLAKVLIQNEGKVTKEVNLLASSAVEKSLIPPWPILAGVILGVIVLAGLGFWWFRRPKPKRL